MGRSKVGGGAALTLAVKDEAEGITVVLCSESDGVIVTSTSHNLLHPGIRGRMRMKVRSEVVEVRSVRYWEERVQKG